MKKIIIDTKKDLIFDYKVIEQCKSCKRFGTKASCPPHIQSMEYYKKLLTSYKYGTLYYHNFKVNTDDWKKLGQESSLKMHKFLLKQRDILIERKHYFAIAFGSGSCKLCPKCAFPCRIPDRALIPLEATGLNIVKIMKAKNINISFPVKNTFYRIGAIFFD